MVVPGNMINNYFLRGFSSAIPILTTNDVEMLHTRLEGWDKQINFMNTEFRHKSNLLFTWAKIIPLVSHL